MRYNITPIAKPRMTQRDKWQKRKCVVKYRAFKDQCRILGIRFPTMGASITFGLPMPASWSRKKRAVMRGLPHQSKPDLDNLLKGLGDAVYPDNDSMISSITVSKVWSEKGYIEVK